MKLLTLLLALVNSWTKIEDGPTTVRPARPKTDIYIQKLVEINEEQMSCMNLTLEFSFWNLEKFILWFGKNKSLEEDRLIGLEIIFKSIYGFHQWYKSKVGVMIHGLTLINLVFTLKFS